MYRKIIFVDLENVPKIGSNIGSNIISDHTKIFVMVGKGKGQEKSAMDLLAETLNKVDAMELIKVNGTGHNALDFFIAFYLGKYYDEFKNSKIVICTKDGGYEPLKNHLLDKNINIIIINDDIAKKFNDVCEHFNTKKDSRPKSLKALRPYLGSNLNGNNYSEDDINKILQLMIDLEKIEITDTEKETIKWLI